MSSSLSTYVLFYIDYGNNNLLSTLLSTYFGSNYTSISIKSIAKNCENINTQICKNCGEFDDECGCFKKDFFKYSTQNEDYTIYQHALSIYSSSFPGRSGFIIFKSTTTTTQENLNQLNLLLTENFSADLFYMAKWLDKKECMEVIKVYPNSLKYIRSYNAIGIQALIFSNNAVEKLKCLKNVVCRPFSLVLLDLIKEGQLIAHSSFPCLFNFDCFETSYKLNCEDKALYDYLKNCEIQGSIFPEEPLNRRFSSDITFFWIFIVILIVIITLVVSQKVGF